jgi:hypothetical protein
MRRLIHRSFSTISKKAMPIRIANVFEPAAGDKPQESEVEGPAWMKFFMHRGSAQIDLDRSLINREDDMDEFSRRFILKNYTQFSTYQLLRSIYFLSRSSDKFQFLWELKKRVAEGDWKIEAEDAVLLAKDLRDLIQSDELLTEFALYQIASNFDQMDLISKFYAMEFQLNNCKVSRPNVTSFCKTLGDAPEMLREQFKSKQVEEQLLIIQVLAMLERTGISTHVPLSELIDIVGAGSSPRILKFSSTKKAWLRL